MEEHPNKQVSGQIQTGILVRIHNQSLSRSNVNGAELQPDRHPVAAASHSLHPATPTDDDGLVTESHIVIPTNANHSQSHRDKFIMNIVLTN